MRGLHIGPGLTRTVAAGFTPAGLAVAWYSAFDASTRFQDAAATTPATADTDPVRKVLDKSVSGLHWTASSDAKRPLYKTTGGLSGFLFDGVNDGFASAATTLPASMDVFISLRNVTDTQWLTLFHGEPSPYIGVAVNGDAGASYTTVGALPPILIDGVVIGPTRDELFDAIGNTAPKVFEMHDIDTTAGPWTTIRIGDYGSFEFGGFIYEVVITPALSSVNRGKIRTYMGGNVGIPL